MVLQWHLTAKCDQNCLHCYVHDGRTYQRELQNELTHKQCIKVVDDYVAMCDTLGRSIRRINFTGGDPLLRPDFFDILAYARGKGIVTGILGNPNHLDYPTAVKLKGLGLSSYQVSIDGMEETHDRFRGRKGLFKDTVRALRLLNEIGINSHVMFTLSRENAHELVDVIRTVVRERVRVFNFDRVVPIGSGEQYGGQQMMTPQESKDVLLKAFSEYTYYQSQGCFTRLGMKDKFWYLLLYELGLLDPARDAYPGIDLGCKIGKEIITVVADGTVMSCRRLPVPLGKVPGQSLLDVFRNAPLHKSFLKEKDIKKCGKCELLHFCKGCPAVAYASCGDFMGADPQCWKQR
jgi:radical SAM protein with 4Fe4S-binding SPASM domain